MRTLLSATALSVLLLSVLVCGPATAGRNANGAMLLHVNNALTYSQLQDYCDDTTYPLPQTCNGLVTNITRDPAVEAMVWMVAAFSDGSSPGINAYQVGLAGDVTTDYFTDFKPCGPGYFEIPDAGWPGTGAGTAVAYSTTVNSILFKMYWFAVGAPGLGSSMSTTNYYAGDHHAEWADDSTPPVTDYCGMFGSVQWGGAGSKECPTPLATGACCFADGSCQNLTQEQCAAQGGTFEGAGTPCDSFQCPQVPAGACCMCPGYCIITTAEECQAMGGIYRGDGSSCDPNLCSWPPDIPGACCLNGVCTIQYENECAQMGGVYQGDCSVCTPNPCPPTPTKATTWGRIRLEYR